MDVEQAWLSVFLQSVVSLCAPFILLLARSASNDFLKQSGLYPWDCAQKGNESQQACHPKKLLQEENVFGQQYQQGNGWCNNKSKGEGDILFWRTFPFINMNLYYAEEATLFACS